MEMYNKAVSFWKQENINTDAELAEALNGYSPVIIHEEDRKEYYSALESRDTVQDLSPMFNFLKEQTAKTWEKQVKRYESKK